MLGNNTHAHTHTHTHTHTHSFLFDTASDGSDYSRMFTVSPSHSTLYPGEKAQAVNITFRATREISIKDLPILKCQVC